MSVRAIAFISFSLGLLYATAYATGLEAYANLALSIQIFVFLVHGLPNMSEKFYDASGSLTHLALILSSLLQHTIRHPRQIVCSVLGIIWLTRLGSFLFQRILRDGRDTRFDRLKKNGLTFFVPWAIQALWVFFIDLPIIIINHHQEPTAHGEAGFGRISYLDMVGWSLWVFGFFFELIADSQKFAFRNKASNHEKFITSGLWAHSQHPNYFGEICMWSAITVSCVSSFTEAQHFLGFISPLFTYVLLMHVSGVPMLRKKADKKWKGNPAYELYIAQTPVLIPKVSPTIIPKDE